MNEQAQQQLAAIRERRAKMPAGDYTKREQHDDWGLVRRPDGWPFADVCMSVDYGHEDVGKTAPDFVDAKREFVSHAVADIDTLLALLDDAERAVNARQAAIVAFIRSRSSVAGELAVKHSTQREFVEEVLAQKRSLTSIADAIERGEFRAKGGGDA